MESPSKIWPKEVNAEQQNNNGNRQDYVHRTEGNGKVQWRELNSNPFLSIFCDFFFSLVANQSVVATVARLLIDFRVYIRNIFLINKERQIQTTENILHSRTSLSFITYSKDGYREVAYAWLRIWTFKKSINVSLAHHLWLHKSYHFIHLDVILCWVWKVYRYTFLWNFK